MILTHNLNNQKMSNLILNHPKRAIIESVIKDANLSYRAKADELAQKHGVKISHGALQKYHTTCLSGEIELEGEGDAGEVLAAPLEIDLDALAELQKSLDKGENAENSVLKRELSELLAMQILITKDALLKHIKGVGRYPSDYVRNLQTISNLLTK
jgi:hypothetical protein